jgi:hypothetical protein
MSSYGMYVIIFIDLVQLRSENMGGHISHPSGKLLFGFILLNCFKMEPI